MYKKNTPGVCNWIQDLLKQTTILIACSVIEIPLATVIYTISAEWFVFYIVSGSSRSSRRLNYPGKYHDYKKSQVQFAPDKLNKVNSN